MQDPVGLPERAAAAPPPDFLEGVARVVALDGAQVWLEPEQTTSCSGCAASVTCGSGGLGTTANRLAMRRFALPNALGLAVGDRVVVGVEDRALLKASGVAYGLPLILALGLGGGAQWAAGSDGITMAATFGGLALGMAAARLAARWMAVRGQLAPRLIRRAHAGETCRID
jgi:sigma-E factor negative regulatory protein RseC